MFDRNGSNYVESVIDAVILGRGHMGEQEVKEYCDLVRRNSDHWKHSQVIDHGIKRMISPSAIGDTLVKCGYFESPSSAKQRIVRHLRDDPRQRRNKRGIVTDEDVRRYCDVFEFRFSKQH